jgi:hypothetical protein
MNKTALLSALILTTLSGCASITGTTGQSVSVEARQQAQQVSGASCELANSKGKWFVTTPGSVQIRRSNDDLIVICTKEGLEPGRATVASETKGSMFGNILFGGGIGAIVDHSSGAAYEYPTLIQIMMGAITSITASNSNTGQGTNASAKTEDAAGSGAFEVARAKCREIGFAEGTEAYGQCVLKLNR